MKTTFDTMMKLCDDISIGFDIEPETFSGFFPVSDLEGNPKELNVLIELSHDGFTLVGTSDSGFQQRYKWHLLGSFYMRSDQGFVMTLQKMINNSGLEYAISLCEDFRENGPSNRLFQWALMMLQVIEDELTGPDSEEFLHEILGDKYDTKNLADIATYCLDTGSGSVYARLVPEWVSWYVDIKMVTGSDKLCSSSILVYITVSSNIDSGKIEVSRNINLQEVIKENSKDDGT